MHSLNLSAVNLEQAVCWNRALWLPPTRFAIGDPCRFKGKRVLDLGSRDGRMAIYFASLGAEVHALDVKEEAVRDIRSLGIEASLVDEEWLLLPDAYYDFIFTKSVLIVHRDLNLAITHIRRALRSGGEYLAVENWKNPLNESIRVIVNRRKFSSKFHYLNTDRLRTIQRHFPALRYSFGPLQFAIGIAAPV